MSGILILVEMKKMDQSLTFFVQDPQIEYAYPAYRWIFIFMK